MANTVSDPETRAGDETSAEPSGSTRSRLWRRLAAGSVALQGLLGFAVIAACWYLTSMLDPRGLLPAPDQVVRDIWQSDIGELVANVLASLRRVTIGLLVGVSLAVPLGFLFAQFQWLSRIFSPVVNFARAIPPIALIPLVVIFFGAGEDARLLVLVASAFFPALVVISEHVLGLDPVYRRAGQTLGTSRLETFYRIVLPLSVPGIFVALRVSLGVTWATVVAAELIAAQEGLGAYIQNASNFFQISEIIAGILLIGTLAVVMDRILQQIQRRFLRWREVAG